MVTSNQILSAARKYLGVFGGSSTHRRIVDVYNSVKPLPVGYILKYSDDWCAAFVSFIGIELNVPGLYGRECGVERFIQIFKKKGIWTENGAITPKPGDIICFNWGQNSQPNDGFADHIGFVESVNGSTITTIEGNKGNTVARRIIPIGWGAIRGYARPAYSNNLSPLKPIATIAQEVINGKWGNGADRTAKLKAAGYNPDSVQAEVNKILKGGSKPTPAQAPAPSTGGWIAQNGTFTSNTAIKLRTGANTGSEVIAILPAGSSVKYNAYMHSGGYVWIRQPRGNGYGYLATGESKNGKRTSHWGSFK